MDAIAEGIITKDDARRKLSEIDAQIAEVDVEEPQRVSREERLAHVEQIRRSWREMTVAEKREAIHLLAERIELIGTAAKKWQRGAWSIRFIWRE